MRRLRRLGRIVIIPVPVLTLSKLLAGILGSEEFLDR